MPADDRPGRSSGPHKPKPGGSGDDLTLQPIAGAPFEFSAIATAATPARGERKLGVAARDPSTGAWVTEEFLLAERSHNAFLDVFEAIARRFGTRMPRNRQPVQTPTFTAPYQPLLTENLSPKVLHGYGDPAVIRVGAEHTGDGVWYYLLATSNDAPDAFPVARSRDLREWSLVGFVFPRGHAPPWAAEGEHVSDYWAPEMHHVGGEFRVYFVAREREGHDLSIGLATSARPDGPFNPLPAPILRGDVIDPHVVVEPDGTAFLFWKEDANDMWPSRLNQLLNEHGRLIADLFRNDRDRRTASLVATLWPWIRTLGPMERFFAQQVMLESVTADFTGFQRRLDGLLVRERNASVRRSIRKVLDVIRTPIHAQQLAPDGRSVVGERTTVLQNDLDWEAHLIEGIWVQRHEGRYYMFYAGNDFSTADYGIGVAIADTVLGPYRKMTEPFLRSTADWWGPGHPSVATGPDGEPWLFLHAFFPGRTGYNEFRALLTVPIRFEPDRVVLREA